MADEDPRTRSPSVRLVKISDLARLSEVPVGTIKYYLRAGLLPGPSKRTSRNMAYYDARLADRVRLIKQLQNRHGLPLRAIGDMLEPAPSASLRRDLDEAQRRQLMRLRPANRDSAAGARSTDDPAGVGLEFTAEEIVRALRIDLAELVELEDAGLLTARRSPSGSAVYSGADLELLEALHDARARGLGDLFSPEALAIYAQAVGELVHKEVALVEEFVGRDRTPAQEPEAPLHEHVERVGERIARAMRSKLLARALRE